MSAPRTMHGARAQFAINGKLIGTISHVNYAVGYDVHPVYILGRFSPNELAITGQEPVSVDATGFRVIEEGPYASLSVPKLQELLSISDVTISIADRQTGKTIMTVTGCVSKGHSSASVARSLQEMSVNFLGLTFSDESDASPQDEAPGASKF